MNPSFLVVIVVWLDVSVQAQVLNLLNDLKAIRNLVSRLQ